YLALAGLRPPRGWPRPGRTTRRRTPGLRPRLLSGGVRCGRQQNLTTLRTTRTDRRRGSFPLPSIGAAISTRDQLKWTGGTPGMFRLLIDPATWSLAWLIESLMPFCTPIAACGLALTAAPPAPSEAAPPAALPVPAKPAIAVPAVAIGPAAVAAPMTGAAIGPRVASAAMIAPEMAEAAVSMVVPLSLRVGPATGRPSA